MATKKIDLSWLVSKGFKRRLASLLLVISGIAQTVPQAAPVLMFLNWAAGFFGIVGVAHAANAGTVKKYKAASVASIMAAFLLLAQTYPVLLPFLPLIQKIAFLFAVLGLIKK